MKNKKFLSLVISLVLLLSIAIVPNGISASAEADIKKPVIDASTLTVSKKEATAGDTVRISVKITDNVKINRVDLGLYSPITKKRDYEIMKYDISSDRYVFDFKITDNTESGLWKIYYIYAVDSSENYIYCYNSTLTSFTPKADLSSADFSVLSAENPPEERYDFEVAIGETLNLSYEANCDVYWQSSDTSIAKIGNTSASIVSIGSYKKVVSGCEVIPVKEGIVTIYAANSNGYALNSAKVKVKKAESTPSVDPNEDITICGQTMIINKSTTLSNQTINKDIYIPKNVTLTLTGNTTIKGNVYDFGTLNNEGTLTITGTLNCLKYGSMMSAGNYNYGYFINSGKANVDKLNVTNSFINYKVPHDFNEWKVTLNPTNASTGIKEHKCKNCGYTETEVIPKTEVQTITLGDITSEGSINSSDALAALQHSVGQITLTGDKFTAGDVDKTGTINSSDALLILQYSVGQISKF